MAAQAAELAAVEKENEQVRMWGSGLQSCTGPGCIPAAALPPAFPLLHQHPAMNQTMSAAAGLPALLQLRARIAVQTVHPTDVMRMNQEK